MVAPSASALEAEKRALRQGLKALRSALDVPGAAQDAAVNFGAVPLALGVPVGGYWPVGAEFDPLPLLRRLAAAGHPVGFPVMAGPAQPLAFRTADLDRPPPPSTYGIPAPPPDAPPVVPALLLVPLLGFDATGWRLGYGGGYYDRTIAALRSEGGLVVVGLAYAAQEVEKVPHGPHDVRLDWIVTEREARRFS